MKKMFGLAALALAMAVPAAMAQDTGNWLVRARALRLDSANKDATGLGLTIDNKTFPEVDISYFLSPNFALELILTYPQKQKVFSNGSEIGTFNETRRNPKPPIGGVEVVLVRCDDGCVRIHGVSPSRYLGAPVRS